MSDCQRANHFPANESHLMTHGTRREFLAQGVLLSGALLSESAAAEPSSVGVEHRHSTTDRPIFLSTWPFGKPSNERALQVFKNSGSVLDAAEKGINLAEEDPSNSSVGLGGIPNAAGVVQLDACIMDGPTHKAGSVGALEGIVNAVSVARRIMEKTWHVMLAGAGAREFAL
ncbi:MAG TPA: isoaspartyl peptidase/L-asparaginase, partial [Verrucomicrobiae bacterium]|nr:isoaspartyl peptidase/L-asparaginase [Verrucomicrobiae bacterium]